MKVPLIIPFVTPRKKIYIKKYDNKKKIQENINTSKSSFPFPSFLLDLA